MILLTITAIAIVTITLICWAVEQYEAMKKAARDLRRFERKLERERGAK